MLSPVVIALLAAVLLWWFSTGAILVAVRLAERGGKRAGLRATALGLPLLGVGGAVDLASGARRLVVTMTHCGRDGTSKVVEECDLPLTASRAVDVLITELAVFRFIDGEMWLSALMPGSNPSPSVGVPRIR